MGKPWSGGWRPREPWAPRQPVSILRPVGPSGPRCPRNSGGPTLDAARYSVGNRSQGSSHLVLTRQLVGGCQGMDCCPIVQTEKTKAQSGEEICLETPSEVVAVGLRSYSSNAAPFSPGPSASPAKGRG